MGNEEDTAKKFVVQVLDHCRGFKSVKYFIVLDHVSKDRTKKIIKEIAEKDSRVILVWSPENRVVVDAYVRGYKEALKAGSTWILEIDAGFSHQPSEIPQFFEKMSRGYDCVFGTRFSKGGRITDSNLKRRMISYGGTKLIRWSLGSQLSDMTSGFEMFTRESLKNILKNGIHSRGHFFQTEIKHFCHRYNFSEVPIHYRSASPGINRKVIIDSLKNLYLLYKNTREPDGN